MSYPSPPHKALVSRLQENGTTRPLVVARVSAGAFAEHAIAGPDAVRTRPPRKGLDAWRKPDRP